MTLFSTFTRRRGTTVTGVLSLAFLSLVLLCGAGSVPIENFAPQGSMSADLNAGGHSITNAATIRATSLVLNGTNVTSGTNGVQGPAGPAGATGPSGVANATAPILYNAGTQTVSVLNASTTNTGVVALGTASTNAAPGNSGLTLNTHAVSLGGSLSLTAADVSADASGAASTAQAAAQASSVQTSALGTGVASALGNAANAANGFAVMDANYRVNQNGLTLVCEGDSITFGAGTTYPGTQTWGYLLSKSSFFAGHLQSYSTTTSGSTASGSTTISVASATGFAVGAVPICTNLATGTYITAVSGTTLTLSAATTGIIPSGTAISTQSYYNDGVSGATVADMIGRYNTNVKPHRPAANGGDGGAKAYLFLMGGTNDSVPASTTTTTASATTGATTLTLASVSGVHLNETQITGTNVSSYVTAIAGNVVTLATPTTGAVASGATITVQCPAAGILAVINTYITQAKADGFTVICETLLPTNGYSNETVREAVNAGLRVNATGIPYDFLADTETVLSSPTDGNLYVAGLHPTPLGNVKLAVYDNAGLISGGWQSRASESIFPDVLYPLNGITGLNGAAVLLNCIQTGNADALYMFNPTMGTNYNRYYFGKDIGTYDCGYFAYYNQGGGSSFRIGVIGGLEDYVDIYGNWRTAGSCIVTTAGSGLQVKEGTNAKQGTATLVNGTVTVSNTSIDASSRVFVSGGALNASTAIGSLGVPTTTNGTSFVITSYVPGGTTTQTGDQRTVNYEIFEASP